MLKAEGSDLVIAASSIADHIWKFLVGHWIFMSKVDASIIAPVEVFKRISNVEQGTPKAEGSDLVIAASSISDHIWKFLVGYWIFISKTNAVIT